jgi:hypothetical protein
MAISPGFSPGISTQPINKGGTGATTASGARSNLGAAASGANSDITSLDSTNGVSVKGTTTNDNAATGYVGEYVSSTVASGSAISLTTGVSVNITNISLTAGDWDVFGIVGFIPSGSTTVAYISGGISTSSAALVENQCFVLSLGSATTSANPRSATPTVRIRIGSTTTVYLVAESSFAVSTNTAFGTIGARRVR